MIQVERLYKSYDRPVLRGASLRANRAEILGLIGPHASGKSVMLRAMAGLVGADAGSVRVAGDELVGASNETLRRVQARIGMLFQNVALFDFMSVGENVAFPLRRRSTLAEDEIRQRVAMELAAVGLSGFEDRMPSGLSGGQKRRVGLARAAVTAPGVLLYDEPAAGLDPVTTSRTFSLLQEQCRRLGAALVVISSDIDRLLPVCQQVAMMHQGRVLFQGTVSSLRALSHPLIEQFLEGRTDGPL
jgi:phospholipid/cholesterol/gamma-HCH transport system ATP-binding protein